MVRPLGSVFHINRPSHQPKASFTATEASVLIPSSRLYFFFVLLSSATRQHHVFLKSWPASPFSPRVLLCPFPTWIPPQSSPSSPPPPRTKRQFNVQLGLQPHATCTPPLKLLQNADDSAQSLWYTFTSDPIRDATTPAQPKRFRRHRFDYEIPNLLRSRLPLLYLQPHQHDLESASLDCTASNSLQQNNQDRLPFYFCYQTK